MKSNAISPRPAACQHRSGGSLAVVWALVSIAVGIGIARADILQIYPSDDAYVNDAFPGTNYGAALGLYVGDQNSNNPIQICRTYLKFDLADIPEGAAITSAKIYLYVVAEGPSPDIIVGVHPLANDGWSEVWITWNNAPTGFSPTPSDQHTITWHWDSWVVTSDVQSTWAGDGIFSAVMKDATEGTDHNWALWVSKEGDPTMRPYLEVEYSDEPPEPGFQAWQDLTGVGKSDAEWGDFDGDGDLDVVICGETTAGVRATMLYMNEAGTLVSQTTNMIGVTSESSDALAAGDYDGDGDLDLALAGTSAAGRVAYVYVNDGGGNFARDTDLHGMAQASLAWGDKDNDGDLDLLLMGHDGTGPVTLLYENDPPGTLAPDSTNSELPGLYCGSADWADWDGDGDQDLILSGHNGSGPQTICYENNPVGMLNDVGSHGFPGLCLSDAAWGDYDNDGDLDLALTGEIAAGGPRCARIYRNEGGGSFTMQADMMSIYRSSCAWGDYDNDGDLDLAFCGYDGGYPGIYTFICENASGNFVQQSFPLVAVRNGSLSWADVDDDGRLDLFVTGEDHTNTYARLYRNTVGLVNAAPTPPTNLQSRMSPTSQGLHLSWSGASDAETPTAGLYYCLRIGTLPYTDDILSGTYGSPLMGNVGQSTILILDVLPRPCYWSVRTIDAGLRPSAWTDPAYCMPDSVAYHRFRPSDDAFVVSSDPNTPHGIATEPHLMSGSFGGPSITRSYLKFELGELLEGMTVLHARMHVHCFSSSWGEGPYYVDAWLEQNDAWSENSITWNNAPTSFAAAATARQCVRAPRHCYWDVTADVQTEANGDRILTEVLRNALPPEGDPNYSAEYWSSEPPGGIPYTHQPYLEVWFTGEGWEQGVPPVPPSIGRLEPNLPNPFDQMTTLTYSLAQAGAVKLTIFDVTGRAVRELARADQPAGRHAVTWDGRNAAGRAAPSGVYWCRFTANDVSETRMMLKR